MALPFLGRLGAQRGLFFIEEVFDFQIEGFDNRLQGDRKVDFITALC